MQSNRMFFALMAAALSVVFTSSCDTSIESLADSPNGIWFNQDQFVPDDNTVRPLIQRYTIQLLSDGRFECERTVRETASDEVLGYRYFATGHFSVEGNILRIVLEQSFTNDDALAPFATRQEWRPAANTKETIVSYTIDNNRMIWRYSPCGPLEDCIDELTFFRM